jgi:hypothetical protein
MTYLTGILLLSGILIGIALVATIFIGFFVAFFGDDYDMEYDRNGRNKNSRGQESSRW